MREIQRGRRSDHGSFIVDRQGTILGFDDGLEALTGWPAVEVVGRHKDFSKVDRSERIGRGTGFPPLYEGEIPRVEEARTLDLSLFGRDGRRLDVEAVARRLAGPGDRVQVTVLRVLARSAQALLAGDLRTRDSLTGLGNREAFDLQIAADLREAMSLARPMALILADVDHLRAINDRLGKEGGDEVLEHLAGVLRVNVQDERRIFRLGDDDFAVILPNAGRGEARQVAAAVRSAVDRDQRLPRPAGDGLKVTVSLGAASVPTDAETQIDLIGRAQEALDEARSMGRNRVWCYLRRPRVPLQVPVYFDGAESLLVGYTRDLSPSGLFVQTAAPIGIGMRCALTFPLPGIDGKVRVIGRVVRTVNPETAHETRELRVPGMGVEFERFGRSSDRRAIDSYVHGLESLSLRPEGERFTVE